MYEYRFVSVPIERTFSLKFKVGSSFEQCKDIINKEATNGWRFKQVVVPVNEKTGIYMPYCYELIFERKLE